ncbi:SusD/RagB family nutrient-binding outer membrane lipoprotein [Segetibacter sp. 3557_3]|uniref:SusD/RagB family nutrient-binding outer membrane lipoprotein n=1 Tax=Segetibacter sp. 3557_3 TaxID=2547429 RepID=UPI001058935A|nr:SusD/RagB family nutrient-binding outer membrane lipoprotein [Segetibacter sp. 3557_3]TDH26393.1 SusD/RagB family nutrient-binding outer membrane lipoprotein [Segetibacter sp. 3557_3]
MRKILSIILVSLAMLSGLTSCKKYLDVNNDPNNPTQVEAALLLTPILQNYSQSVQVDNRYMGRYVQMWQYGSTSGDQWDQHGYVRNTDRGSAMFRAVYWRGGYNLINMIKDAIANEKWDYAGVGYALKAYGYQTITDIHGEIILNEAFTPGKTSFRYDKQEDVYMAVRRFCDTALMYLNKTDGKVSTQSLGRGDQVYKGDRTKWIKFVYAVLARNYNHLSKKSALYKPDSVIYFADRAFASNADDAMTPSEGASGADASPFGQSRATIASEEAFSAMGQSRYAIALMDSTLFGGVKVTDPRLPLMLYPSTDGVYRGLNPARGVTEITVVAQRVPNMYGLVMGTLPTLTQPGKYLWRNDAPVPMMTYAEMQFIIAEAAFRSNQPQLAYEAYKKGISASLDFVGTIPGYSKTGYTPGSGTSLITAAQKTAYTTNPAIVPASAAELTLSKIMMQKWIALYGWGAHEVWVDMRRNDYDPAIYNGFNVPNPLFTDNNTKVVQRLRPRYNSEYIWNIEALTEIGGMNADFHTLPVWFALP